MEAPSEHARRAAENQSLFRQVNERIKELNAVFDQLTPYASWACECANLGCIERIELTLAEYEELRGYPTRFAVAPDETHLVQGVERVVHQTGRYWVVEKVGEAAERATDLSAQA
jgi:hypothetical protein